MKRILSIVLVLVLALSMFAGCSGDVSELPEVPTTPTENPTETPNPTTGVTPEELGGKPTGGGSGGGGGGNRPSGEEITVTISLEAASVGGGFIIEPQQITLITGSTDNAQAAMNQFFGINGVAYDYVGKPQESTFYLKSVTSQKIKKDKWVMPTIVMGKIGEVNYIKPTKDFTKLGEFDFTAESGWMYSVNNVFPDRSFGAYILEDDDVMRIQFTTACGADIGGTMTPTPNFFTLSSKTKLTRLLGTLKEDEKSGVAYNDAIACMLNLDVSDGDIQTVYDALRNKINS